MQTILVYIGNTPRFFNVRDGVDDRCVQAAFQQMLDNLREQGRPIRTSDIPNDMLRAYGLSPAPISFVAFVPDTSLLAEVMEKDGISFACCSKCEHYSCGTCQKYGDAIDRPDDMNRDCCISEGIYQVFNVSDKDTVLAYFILHDKSLLENQHILLERLRKYFPNLKDVGDAVVLPH